MYILYVLQCMFSDFWFLTFTLFSLSRFLVSGFRVAFLFLVSHFLFLKMCPLKLKLTIPWSTWAQNLLAINLEVTLDLQLTSPCIIASWPSASYTAQCTYANQPRSPHAAPVKYCKFAIFALGLPLDHLSTYS